MLIDAKIRFKRVFFCRSVPPVLLRSFFKMGGSPSENMKLQLSLFFFVGPAPPFSPRGEEKSFGGENETKPIAAGQNSKNGHSAAVNGTTNGTNGEQTNGDSTIIKPNDVANKETAKMKDEEMKPSSNLKCLEDPNFSFDEAPSHPQPASTNPTANLAVSESKGSTEAAGVAGKKPSYRVLEDPDVNVPKPKTTGYKVVK